MLGVDRLDMIKGIPQKLLAFEMFLEKHPEWQENVLLVQIAVPTRTDVPECKLLIQFCWKGDTFARSCMMLNGIVFLAEVLNLLRT
jgi:hypothetical protein